MRVPLAVRPDQFLQEHERLLVLFPDVDVVGQHVVQPAEITASRTVQPLDFVDAVEVRLELRRVLRDKPVAFGADGVGPEVGVFDALESLVTGDVVRRRVQGTQRVHALVLGACATFPHR